MLKSEVQHQFWVTKKVVQRKLGSKEDEHIVSSDAGLDSKIALFKSISETCSYLSKIVDQYQDRLCVLSQEECTFGRFLKEIGKRSKTTSSSITNSGKAIYYCGQQRMAIRVPLVRLQQEVDVFRLRAVGDTLMTVNSMEKERTEYRAALCWMKSISAQLDPDNGRGLDKFRRAQSHVRIAKENFDKLSMDCIQKIDLLVAARCNMFSHGLVAYMSSILQFSKKASSTFQNVSSSLVLYPRYDFCVLKDLSQCNVQLKEEVKEITTEDIDQSVLFSEDYHDDAEPLLQKAKNKNEIDNMLIELSQTIEEITNSSRNPENGLPNICCNADSVTKSITDEPDLRSTHTQSTHSSVQSQKEQSAIRRKTNIKNNEISSISENKHATKWLDLFSDLDPLENLQTFDLKFTGKLNAQQI